MPHDLSHLGFLAGQIGRLITISTTPAIAGDSFEMDAVEMVIRSEERFSRNAETDLVCRLLLDKTKPSLAARPPSRRPAAARRLRARLEPHGHQPQCDSRCR